MVWNYHRLKYRIRKVQNSSFRGTWFCSYIWGFSKLVFESQKSNCGPFQNHTLKSSMFSMSSVPTFHHYLCCIQTNVFELPHWSNEPHYFQYHYHRIFASWILQIPPCTNTHSRVCKRWLKHRVLDRTFCRLPTKDCWCNAERCMVRRFVMPSLRLSTAYWWGKCLFPEILRLASWSRRFACQMNFSWIINKKCWTKSAVDKSVERSWILA